MGRTSLDRVRVSLDSDSETGGFWACIPEMPGCFASGRNLDELFVSLSDAVQLYEYSRLDLRGLN
ncbi:MAG: type II toxin-antitoxin system HicB family antitoxin [Actinomycetota bacterium]|nr:type II toxin-antitoxin system HicB family antitoxin [Actinomycetota bacterium]